MITGATPWRSTGIVPYSRWVAVIAAAGGPDELRAQTAYDAAGNLSALCLAMMGEESEYGTRHGGDPAGNKNALNLRPRGEDGFLAFRTYTACIEEWRDRITDPAYAYRTTVTIADLIAAYAPSSDGNNTQRYIADVVQRLNNWNGGTMTRYPVAGLSKPIELPVPLIQQIIPNGQTNQRPGIKRQLPGYWVQHETANENAGADAAMHSRWLNNGADGGQVSFHFVVDDHSVYQMIPVDEVTWQAADGGGPGNMSGISCELCVNADGDETKARHNAEALAGAICKALGLGVDRVKRHWDFNAGTADRHHCPDHMMNENYWPTFVANVGKVVAGGSKPVAEPFGITWEPGAVGVQTIGDSKALALLGEVTARRSVPLRQSADSKSPVVHTLKQGEKGTIVGTLRSPNGGRKWAFIQFADGKYGRCLLSALTPSFPTL